MKIKNVAIINNATVVINYVVDDKENAFYFNNTTNVAEAIHAFVEMFSVGLV